MPGRGALIVGIDQYDKEPLQGCVRDAKKMENVLLRHDDHDQMPNFECSLLTSDDYTITCASLTRELVDLFDRNLDVALFYFAGHGTANNLGGYIATQDAKAYYAGVSIVNLLGLANSSKAREVIIILDCCYSINFGAPPAEYNDRVILREGVSVLTASGSAQSLQDREDGIFTELVCEALQGGGADIMGNVTIASVYARVEQALGNFHKRPLFQSHVCEFTPLKKCKPEVEPKALRLLPQLFSKPDAEKSLTPSYLKSQGEKVAKEEHVKIFKILKGMRKASLVVPVGEEHMYYSALNNKSCKLTALGKYYWSQAKKGKI